MKRLQPVLQRAGLGVLVTAAASCISLPQTPLDRPIETSVNFTNLSRAYYAAFSIRVHGPEEETGYRPVPLLPPGATHRVRWLDLVGAACPGEVDLRVALYRRVRHDRPIGLDEGEVVENAPLAAGEVLGLPACRVQELETYTIVNWDAPAGQARVKIAQGTLVEADLRSSEVFGNPEGLWEFTGVGPDVPLSGPPPPLPLEPISGRVMTAEGAGAAGVFVLLRTRFRVRADDDDPTNDPDAGYGLPIDFRVTDASGAFSFARPPGGYEVEFASDDHLFRPAEIEIESPVEAVLTVVEPLR